MLIHRKFLFIFLLSKQTMQSDHLCAEELVWFEGPGSPTPTPCPRAKRWAPSFTARSGFSHCPPVFKNKICYFLQSLVTLHVTLLMQKYANVPIKSQLPGWGCPTEKIMKEMRSSLHTTYCKAHNLQSATSISQLSKLCSTTYHFLANWLTQKSRRETMSAVGRQQWAQPAKPACFHEGRGHSTGHKERRLRFALEQAIRWGSDHGGHKKKGEGRKSTPRERAFYFYCS